MLRPVAHSAEPTDDVARHRHRYLRVHSQAQNRLTVSTFLAGLTFGAVTGLITTHPFTSLDPSVVLLAVTDMLLVTATFLFLLTAVATYFALQRLADLSPTAVTQLRDAAAAPLSAADARRLDLAYRVYTAPGRFLYIGLFLILCSVLLLCFRLSWPIGVIAILTLLLPAVFLRDFLLAWRRRET